MRLKSLIPVAHLAGWAEHEAWRVILSPVLIPESAGAGQGDLETLAANQSAKFLATAEASAYGLLHRGNREVRFLHPLTPDLPAAPLDTAWQHGDRLGMAIRIGQRNMR